MKTLITGVGGFVGRHLAQRLLNTEDVEVHGVVRQTTEHYSDLLNQGIQLHPLNLADEVAVHQLLKELAPQQIYHLAAQAFVPESFSNPWSTIENNIRAELNILTQLAQEGSSARVLIVSSAEVYGTVGVDDLPINEMQPLAPTNPYSVSKVTQDLLGQQYYFSHALQTIRVRPFNHAGPGQNKRFVVPAFAGQIANIEAGRQDPVMAVGNLSAERDFTDVRDIAEAYVAVMQYGSPGEVYNVGSGHCVSIQHLLDTLLSLTDISIHVITDPDRFRPVDVERVICDNSKLVAATGWQPRIPLTKTLADVLQACRRRVAS